MKKHAKKAKEKAAPKKAAPKAAPKKKPAKKPPNKILREELPESEKREILDEIAAENDTSCVILENFSYPTGLIGYTFDEDGKMRAVYSEERIIEDLMNEGMTEEDASVSAVGIHSLSGRLCAADHGKRAMLPTMLWEYFDKCFTMLKWEEGIEK